MDRLSMIWPRARLLTLEGSLVLTSNRLTGEGSLASINRSASTAVDIVKGGSGSWY